MVICAWCQNRTCPVLIHPTSWLSAVPAWRFFGRSSQGNLPDTASLFSQRLRLLQNLLPRFSETLLEVRQLEEDLFALGGFGSVRALLDHETIALLAGCALLELVLLRRCVAAHSPRVERLLPESIEPCLQLLRALVKALEVLLRALVLLESVIHSRL